jgi:hypothetical protein
LSKDIIGTQIGIYDILYECNYKTNCGHKLYHVKCSKCGWETDMQKSDIPRAQQCTHIGKLTQEQINAWYEKNKKICLQCGEHIPFTTLSFHDYRERKFCNSSCAASYNNRLAKKKSRINNCINCGIEIKYPNKYCSLTCQVNFQFKEYINKWKNGEVNGMSGKYAVSKYLKRYLMEKHGYKCSQCGWGEVNPFTNRIPLEVHHKDGDYTNNDENNLELLCPNCHSLTATYKAANKGSGRKDRKKYS